jgi:hypothetical protein
VRVELGHKDELDRADRWQDPACGHHDGIKGLVQIAPGFSSFKLVVLSLQLGEVGPYLVRGTWFPNCLPREGTGLYSDSFKS